MSGEPGAISFRQLSEELGLPYDDASLAKVFVEAALSQRDAARSEAAHLREAIENAPHGGDCDSHLLTLGRPCSCWKAEALSDPAPTGDAT